MKKRGDWLKERREELKALDKKRFSVRAVAERVGISYAGLSHLENNDAMPALDLAFRLARELDRSVEWVLTGVGDGSSTGIPIIGTTLSGPDMTWLENSGRGSTVHEYVNVPVKSHRLYGLKVSSDQSLSRYYEGEVVIADPDLAPVTGEDVVVVTKLDDGSVVKVLASQRDNKVFLDSPDDRYQRVIRDLDEIILMHPVVLVAKSTAIKVK
ncbi:helix-turn-helix protein [Komagataeibacter europaeus]|uniref:Helix-turn-helix protein n=1 Tax=Komagataeibacter europaeus TaxID=33995 RepID=A0A0M0EBX6_KOMEU|nr:LexA family transcriptional regulator [Komagataeibacter europaeus]KON62787.1 helix-turn-helix protein [Komagataeibacter europaeus]